MSNPKKLFCFILLLMTVWISGCFNHDLLEKKIKKTDQNPSHYISSKAPTLQVSPEQLVQLTHIFLTLYFSPWNEHQQAITDSILTEVKNDYDKYSKKPGWKFNQHTFSQNDIQVLIDNSDLEKFPNVNQPGIIVHYTDVRIFPTLLPSYDEPDDYPFDSWINSTLMPGTPIRILHKSKDQLWYLINNSSFYGWVPVENVGFVDADFMNEWKKYPFLVSLKDNIALQNEKGISLGYMRKGLLYPNPTQQNNKKEILMPILDSQGYARVMHLFTNDTNTHVFPIPLSAENVASLAKTFIGTPYGWGGLYQLRDCSSTMQDLFNGFGLWLPRNSSQQVKMGRVIELSGKNRKEKSQIIINQGVPFFTLIHFPGHVGLYLGNKNGHIYLLQQMWSVHYMNALGRNDRAVAGRTVITTLDISQGYLNVPNSQLDRADSLNILDPQAYSDPESILQKIWYIPPTLPIK